MIVTLAIIAFLLNAALVGAGIYLSSYLKKKAEHLATREQFKDLQKETAELTRTTKEIEAKISDEVWNRQRRWELKRDLLLDMAKKMSAAYDALTAVYATYNETAKRAKTGDVLPERAGAIGKWASASTEFDTMVSQVALVCNPELTQALRVLRIHMGTTYQNTTMKGPEEYNKAIPEYVTKIYAIQTMIRKELGIDPDQAG